jgi:hypothetical protein
MKNILLDLKQFIANRFNKPQPTSKELALEFFNSLSPEKQNSLKVMTKIITD